MYSTMGASHEMGAHSTLVIIGSKPLKSPLIFQLFPSWPKTCPRILKEEEGKFLPRLKAKGISHDSLNGDVKNLPIGKSF